MRGNAVSANRGKRRRGEGRESEGRGKGGRGGTGDVEELLAHVEELSVTGARLKSNQICRRPQLTRTPQTV